MAASATHTLRTRAARLHRHGDPVVIEDVTLAEPGPGEVLVTLRRAGVNPIDRYVAAGTVAAEGPLPRTIGLEAVGEVDGSPVLVHGHGLGMTRDGVYAGHLTDGLDGVARPAAVSVGTNPQFGTERRRVEAHVLDFDGDLYGHRVSVGFAHRLRGQAVFAGVEELAAQMRADADQARRLLSSPPGGTVRPGGFSRPTS